VCDEGEESRPDKSRRGRPSRGEPPRAFRQPPRGARRAHGRARRGTRCPPRPAPPRRVADGQSHRRLGVDGLGSRPHVAGGVGLQVAGRDGGVPLEARPGHTPNCARDPGVTRRTGSGMLKAAASTSSAVLDEMHRAGGAAIAADEVLEPEIRPCVSAITHLARRLRRRPRSAQYTFSSSGMKAPGFPRKRHRPSSSASRPSSSTRWSSPPAFYSPDNPALADVLARLERPASIGSSS
jgi:hypothetical protein